VKLHFHRGTKIDKGDQFWLPKLVRGNWFWWQTDFFITAQNFGGSTHPDILVEKNLADGDNKSLLLVRTELIVTWLHDDNVFLHFSC